MSSNELRPGGGSPPPPGTPATGLPGPRTPVRALRSTTALLAVGLALTVVVGCQPSTVGPSSPRATGSPGRGAASGTPTDRPTPTPSEGGGSRAPDGRLPAGFPVMPGAHLLEPTAEPGVIAAWRVESVGSAAYDFYSTALPRSGYPILGSYP